ncbi:hypothetical protein ACET3Z_003629 [Daucus carota]
MRVQTRIRQLAAPVPAGASSGNITNIGMWYYGGLVGAANNNHIGTSSSAPFDNSYSNQAFNNGWQEISNLFFGHNTNGGQLSNQLVAGQSSAQKSWFDDDEAFLPDNFLLDLFPGEDEDLFLGDMMNLVAAEDNDVRVADAKDAENSGDHDKDDENSGDNRDVGLADYKDAGNSEATDKDGQNSGNC